MNVLLAATHSNSFTTLDTKRTKGQGPGLVNVLLPPAQRLVHDLGRLRARSQDWWTFFCCQSNNAFSRRKAEVVNGLLWVAAKRTFTSPGPWPFIVEL
jgi:hypothetical protein